MSNVKAKKTTTTKTTKKAPAKTKDNTKSKNVPAQPEEEMVCIIRIRGAHGMRRTILRTLQLLNLHKVNHATIVKATPSVKGMLQKAKDYIAYGPISKEMTRKLLTKRALIEGNKPLTDDYVRFATVYESVDKLADALHDGRISLREVPKLKPVFRLHPPRGGHMGSIKKPIGSGGVLGNVGDKINLYLKKMI